MISVSSNKLRMDFALLDDSRFARALLDPRPRTGHLGRLVNPHASMTGTLAAYLRMPGVARMDRLLGWTHGWLA